MRTVTLPRTPFSTLAPGELLFIPQHPAQRSLAAPGMQRSGSVFGAPGGPARCSGKVLGNVDLKSIDRTVQEMRLLEQLKLVDALLARQ